jgi:D-hexose-6-phosphate mutarotase
MKWMVAALLSGCVWGQSTGFDNEWDVRKLLQTLTAGTKRVRPILEQADPQKWNDASSGQAYSAQWKTALNEIQYLNTTTEGFAKQPERLTLALETYFRLQAMETSLSSFVDGMRKYGNPAVADLLEGTMRENSANREHLKQYITELAQTKEQECQIMDKEAQRCRATLSKQPSGPASRPRATQRKQE